MRITNADIRQALTVEDFLESCHEAFRLYGSGDLLNPPRQETVSRDGDSDRFRLELPAEWPGRFRARKVIEERSDVNTGRLGERTAVIELEDLGSGNRIQLDAEHITNMRTGAAGALGARYLGPAAVDKVSILGTGRIAHALALCVDRVLRPGEIVATSRRPQNREAFEANVGDVVQAGVRTVDSVAGCVRDARAVVAAVPAPEPILMGGDVADGTHLSVVGGDPRTTQLGMDLLCSRPVVVDKAEQAADSGDFRVAEAAGKASEVTLVRGDEGRVMTIGDAALGRLEHLRGQGAIAYFTGLAAQDLHAAVTAYRRVVLGEGNAK
ncbi:MAG: NAD(P)-binding domain-containing protein [Candidatus Latescibacteria bacterium]|jgi:alanine dehydrogenase|nr:NAD(P)-binding domain-containing protein [Candidatus Latescibacterota bacterium]